MAGFGVTNRLELRVIAIVSSAVGLTRPRTGEPGGEDRPDEQLTLCQSHAPAFTTGDTAATLELAQSRHYANYNTDSSSRCFVVSNILTYSPYQFTLKLFRIYPSSIQSRRVHFNNYYIYIYNY